MTEPTDPIENSSRKRIAEDLLGPLAVSTLTLLAVLLTLDPSNARPNLPEGPGITLDESFNVQMGVYLFENLKSYGLGIVDPRSLNEVFGDPAYNPDHPPLGRLWLGVFHDISGIVAPINSGNYPFVTVHARAGSAVAFSLTVLLVGLFATRRWGRLSGVTASVCLAVMPRSFGHAHLASLESCMSLMWMLVILAAIHFWTRNAKHTTEPATTVAPQDRTISEVPNARSAAIIGLLTGLALLTKIQAVVLPPLIIVWAFWHWRLSALRPVVVTLLSAAAVFLVGWPWLWLDFPQHLLEYFGRTTARISLNVWYLGQSFRDVDAPWHYPWVMTFATVPLGTLLLASCGVWVHRRSLRSNPVVSLILGSIVGPLLLFSLPGVAVYDGVRLFLVVFPGIAILAGAGIVPVRNWLHRRKIPDAIVLTLILLPQCTGIASTSPYFLSYYNAVVGGVSGAAVLGFETTYWGDSFSRKFLSSVTASAGGNVVQVAPVLHQFQLHELEQQTSFQPEKAEPALRLTPFDPDSKHRVQTARTVQGIDTSSEYLAVFHRQADAPSAQTLQHSGWQIVDSVTCQGVDVASLWRRTTDARGH